MGITFCRKSRLGWHWLNISLLDFSHKNKFIEQINYHVLILVGFDLCTLASSDHSIYAYGTFGLWGSLLAGGDVIVSKSRTKDEKGFNEDNFHKNNAMQGWLFIDTLDPEKIRILKLDHENREFVVANSF